MLREKEAFDPTQPALLVTYGNTAKKHKHLDSGVIVLGRSNVCDFSLVSPEVAPIHCVLVRVAQGWKLRDCSGRPGTRVNGRVIQETLLDDSDIIQIGAFSFQVHLPPGHGPGVAPISPSFVERLQSSRKRLAERALFLRRKLAEQGDAEAQVAQREADLAVHVESLRLRHREYELRMTRLELSERDLATDRATLEKEYRELQEELDRQAANVRLFREESARREKELEDRAAEVEARLKREQATPEERTQELDRRERELDHFARHLRQLRQSAPPSPLPALELLAQIVDATREQQEEMGRLMESVREVVRESGRRDSTCLAIVAE